MKEEMMEQTDDKKDCSQIFEEKAMLEIMKREIDPFKSLTIDDVAKDLNICKDKAYKIFRMKDFPCSRIGRKKTITQGAYLLWKIRKELIYKEV